MNGRRRNPRYLLSTPLDGHLHLRDEVSIESWSDQEIEVLSTVPGRPGERLLLELAGDGTEPLSVVVAECKPVVMPDGSIRHRIRLAPQASPGSPDVLHSEGSEGRE